METFVEIKQLTKEFSGFKAVDHISFKVTQGQVLGFLGPNGAGKSTTMKMITGYLPPTAGDISIAGINILEEPLEAKKLIGYLPEGSPAYPDMTPKEFLDFIAKIRGLRGDEKTSRLKEVIDRIDLGHVLNQPIETLSKGFKRRVGLAQAILHNPPILILDEPTDGLDPNQKHEVRTLIQEMAKDKVIILSTHILEEVDAVCNRAIIIASGKVVADATPKELEQQAPSHNSVTVGLHKIVATEAQSVLQNLSGLSTLEVLKEDENTIYFRAIPKEGQVIIDKISDITREKRWLIHELVVHPGQLDEYFRTVTTQVQNRT